MSNFKICFDFTIGAEGGYQDNSQDPGNWTGGAVGVGELLGTKYGISAAQYPNLDIKALTEQQAESIYISDYYAPIHGDELPLPLAMVTFDAAVNSGPFKAIQWLQRGVGAYQDGIIGRSTLLAAHTCIYRQAVQIACDARLQFLEGLRLWATFGQGWANRVEALQTAALSHC